MKQNVYKVMAACVLLIMTSFATAGATDLLILSRGTSDPVAGEFDCTEPVVLMQAKLTTAGVDTTSFDTLAVTIGGSIDSDAITAVKLYKDNGNGVLSATDLLVASVDSLDSLGRAVFLQPFLVPPGDAKAVTFLIVLTTDGTPAHGQTASANFAAGSIVAKGTSSGATPTITGLPLSGRTHTVKKASLSVCASATNPADGRVTVNNPYVTVIGMQVTSTPAAPVTVDKVVVQASGSADEIADIVDNGVRLCADTNNNGVWNQGKDVTLGTGSYDADNGQIVFTGMSNRIIWGGTTDNWLLVYNTASDISHAETFQATVLIDSMRVKNFDGDSVNVIGEDIVGGEVFIEREGTMNVSLAGALPESLVIGAGAEDVVMLMVEVEASRIETLFVSEFNVNASGSGDDVNGITSVALWEDVDGNGRFDRTQDELLDDAATYDADNGVATFNIPEALQQFDPNETHTWMVIQSFAAGVADGDVFTVSLDDATCLAPLDTGDVARHVEGFPVTGVVYTVSDEGALTVADIVEPGQVRVAAPGDTDAVCGQIRFTASTVETLMVSRVVVNLLGTGEDSGDVVNVKLWVDEDNDGVLTPETDTELDSVAGPGIDNGLVVFESDGDGLAIPKGESVDLLVTLSLVDSLYHGTTYGVSIPANDSITVKNTDGDARDQVAGAPLAGQCLSIVNPGALAVTIGANSPQLDTVMAGETGIVMCQLQLTASAVETLKVTGFTLESNGTGDDKNGVSCVSLWKDVDGDGEFDENTDVSLGTTTCYVDDDSTVTITLENGGLVINPEETCAVLVVQGFQKNNNSDNDTYTVTVKEVSVVGTAGEARSFSGDNLEGALVTIEGMVGVEEDRPLEFSLSQNAPNPFNPVTNINFTLPQAGNARLVIYNVTGQAVRTLVNGNLSAGVHSVSWNARDDAGRALGSGIYIYRLTSNQGVQVRRMVLTR